MIGKTISHYKILEKLGAGGMGTVYKAQDTRLDRFVALKFLPPHLSQAEEHKKRFIHEAKAASALNHQNIAHIYEIDEAEGQMFIAMEYIEGRDLKSIIDTPLSPPSRGELKGGVSGLGSKPLALHDALNYATQIAEGLAKAHEKNIIHRDIKPENILVTKDGVVKIVDFGLAKLAGRTMLTKEGTSMGTVAYMSPEQTQGAKVDHRTDIWALGAVIYEMITGKQPFAGDYEQAVMYSIMNQDPEPLTGLRTGVPMELERQVNKTLAKNPDERYQRIEELLVDLKAVRKAAASKDVVKPPKAVRGKTRIYAGLAALMVLLAVLGWYVTRGNRATVPHTEGQKLQRLAVLPFSNLRGDAEIDFLGIALADQVIGSMTYLKTILVRPSSAVRKYQDEPVDAPTAGKELNVDYVLTGNYLKEGDLVRLNIELVNAHSNTLIWREPIEVAYENAFRLQDMVAEKVTAGLKVQFSPEERDRMHADVPNNPLAYDYYLRSIAYPLSLEGNRLAIEMLRKSIRLDSTYAPAYYELGWRSQQISQYELGGTDKIHRAEQAYLKALSLNEKLPPAISNLAMVYAETNQAGKAVKLLRDLVALNPNDAEGHFALSYVYRYAGMLEASAEEAEIALSLDPNNRIFRSIAITYGYLGEFETGLQRLHLDPGSPWTLSWLGETYLRMGQPGRAIEHFNRAIELEPDGVVGYWSLAMKSSLQGDPQAGLRALQKWQATNIVDGELLYHLANTYGLLGDKAACIEALEKAVDAGFFNYPFMMRDFFLDSVRDEPEFQRVLAKAKDKHENFKRQFF